MSETYRTKLAGAAVLSLVTLAVSGSLLWAQDGGRPARPAASKAVADADLDRGAYEPSPPQPAGPDCLDAVPVCVKNPNVNVNVTNGGLNVAVTNRPGVMLQGMTLNYMDTLIAILQDQTDQLKERLSRLEVGGFYPLEVYLPPSTSVTPWSNVLLESREISYIHIQNGDPESAPVAGNAYSRVHLEWECQSAYPDVIVNTGTYRTVGNASTAAELPGYLIVCWADTFQITNTGTSGATVKVFWRRAPAFVP
ncbi:MAG: hypothetical protein LC135_10350 [Phycisphaerae bacterium]|nr:hypothetical protein [Phycisphaerae bacterium]MCZ2400249.1 hypothetical protein [Phycisphaerae bacterium]NUQ50924.1 hypothetical protein [Phycisphaerae bacterium]